MSRNTAPAIPPATPLSTFCLPPGARYGASACARFGTVKVCSQTLPGPVSRHEQAITTEERVGETAHQRDIEAHAVLEHADVARMHLQRLPGSEVVGHHLSPELHPRGARAGQALQQKAVAAEDAWNPVVSCRPSVPQRNPWR